MNYALLWYPKQAVYHNKLCTIQQHDINKGEYIPTSPTSTPQLTHTSRSHNTTYLHLYTLNIHSIRSPVCISNTQHSAPTILHWINMESHNTRFLKPLILTKYHLRLLPLINEHQDTTQDSAIHVLPYLNKWIRHYGGRKVHRGQYQQLLLPWCLPFGFQTEPPDGTAEMRLRVPPLSGVARWRVCFQGY